MAKRTVGPQYSAELADAVPQRKATKAKKTKKDASGSKGAVGPHNGALRSLTRRSREATSRGRTWQRKIASLVAQ